MNDLTNEECRFLLLVGDKGLVSFKPREDEVIARLLDIGLIYEDQADAETALLLLTPDGVIRAMRRRAEGAILAPMTPQDERARLLLFGVSRSVSSINRSPRNLKPLSESGTSMGTSGK